MFDKFTDYLLARADNVTAWIGVIGLVLFFLHLWSLLFVLFILLIVLPEGKFSGVFKGWTTDLRNLDQKHKPKP